MPDEKLPGSGQTNASREFFERFNALRAEGKTISQALDEMGDGFEEMLSRISLPKDDKIHVINPPEYQRLMDAARMFRAMGFTDEEVDVQINGRHCLGYLTVVSDEMIFDFDCVSLLYEILGGVGGASFEARADDKVALSLTIPRVLKPL